VTNPGGGDTCAWHPTRHNGPQPCPAAYRLLTRSLGLDAGVDLQAAPYNLDVGTRDYYGNPITTTPNIGADQSQVVCTACYRHGPRGSAREGHPE
jgi:hypothetical protein